MYNLSIPRSLRTSSYSDVSLKLCLQSIREGVTNTETETELTTELTTGNINTIVNDL